MKFTMGRLRRLIDELGYQKAQEVNIEGSPGELRLTFEGARGKYIIEYRIEHTEKGEEVKARMTTIEEHRHI